MSRSSRLAAMTAPLLLCSLPVASSTAAGPDVRPASAGSATAGTGGREMMIGFDGVRRPLTDGASLGTVGDGDLEAVVRSQAGGALGPVPGRAGGTAARLPDFKEGATSATVPLAVLRVGQGDAGVLDPGYQAFSFGASFKLPAGVGVSDVDNGNNLLQRGLYDDAAQYKLEIDGRRPACRVKGADGELTVRAARTVGSKRWFSVRCRRADEALTLTLTHRTADGVVRETWTANGRTGSLSALPDAVPAAVGGKLSHDGSLIRSASDQFNGLVDNVFVDIAD